MPYEYLASVQSATRRVNDRIQTLASHFGKNSAIVNNAMSKIEVLLGDNVRYKNGVIQISRPSDIYEDQEKMQALAELDNTVKTWGEYRQRYENEYDEYKKESGQTLDMPDFIQTMQNLDSALREVPSDSMPKDARDIMTIRGRKKSYNELFDVYNILKEKGLV